MRTALIIIAVLGLATVKAHKFSVCSGAKDHLGTSGITLTPDPVVAGQELKVELDGKVDEAIASGKAKVEIIAFGVPIATLNLDVCKDMGVTCPVAAGGAFKATFSYKIPALAKGINSASAKLTVTDDSAAQISCLDIPIGDIKGEAQPLLRTAAAAPAEPLAREQVEYFFETWKREFNVAFESADEYVKRLNIFSANLGLINAHNAKGASWSMALNEFAHLSWHEFRSTRLGFRKPHVIVPLGVEHVTEGHADAVAGDLASEVDWTTKGAVTVVKNQAQCGSCWAFSTTGGLEGAFFLKNGHLPNNGASDWTQAGFSEQMLVDCDTTDNGCNGGLMDNAFKWIKKQGGLCLEKDYPYQGTTDSCDDSSCDVVEGSDLTRFTDVQESSTALMAAVAQQPVSIAIEADQQGFQFYSGGVFTAECGTQLDHGVLVVGYGTEDGTDFWKVKNSWGATWGSEGYIKLERGKDQTGGQCGILMSASYPTL